MADGEQPATPDASDDGEPVTGITVPIRLEYEINAGRAPSKYLRGHRRGQAHRPEGRRLRRGVPAAARLGPHERRAHRDRGRGLAERHRHHVLHHEHPRAVRERARGAVRRRADPARRRRTRPYLGLIQGIPVDEVRMGLRVQAVWDENLRPDAALPQVVRAQRRARRRLRVLPRVARPTEQPPPPSGPTQRPSVRRDADVSESPSASEGGAEVMRDVGSSFAQDTAEKDRERNEVEFIIPVVQEAVRQSGHGPPRHRLHDLRDRATT